MYSSQALSQMVQVKHATLLKEQSGTPGELDSKLSQDGDSDDAAQPNKVTGSAFRDDYIKTILNRSSCLSKFECVMASSLNRITTLEGDDQAPLPTSTWKEYTVWTRLQAIGSIPANTTYWPDVIAVNYYNTVYLRRYVISTILTPEAPRLKENSLWFFYHHIKWWFTRYAGVPGPEYTVSANNRKIKQISGIFIHLGLLFSVAIHEFKWVKIWFRFLGVYTVFI